MPPKSKPTAAGTRARAMTVAEALMPNSRTKVKPQAAAETTTMTVTTTVVTTTIRAPVKKQPARPVTTAKTTSPSEAPLTEEVAARKQRRSIPLLLKAEFTKDLEAQRQLHPKLSAASVARWDKYNFNEAETSCIIQD
ncbi:hypothetical protein BGZ51_009255 [Haplosporangium sp. Z 767]|nr:hypothetical protein BGZ51_009255 [Haplosporangium sp. Z 767]